MVPSGSLLHDRHEMRRSVPSPLPSTRSSAAGRPERGTAVLEFSIVMVLLFTLVYGIISFGVLLGFRQNLVQSAAEGARAGAVADRAVAEAAATAATNQSVAAYGEVCLPVGSGAPLECS